MKSLKGNLAAACAFWLASLSGTYAATPTGPPLQGILTTNGVVLSWPDPGDNFLLLTTDRLGPKANWWPARRDAVALQGVRSVSVRPVASPRFYQLTTNDYVAWLHTVRGPEAFELEGIVLPHEHVFTDLRGPTTAGYGQADVEDVVRVMKPLLVEAKSQGISMLIECTGIGVGRNVGVIQRLAAESDLAIAIPTGVYGRANFAPAEHRAMTEQDLATLFINELRDGIEGTGVRAGFLKVATSDTGMTALEEKYLRAAGQAAARTGAAVASHTVLGSVAKKQADILESISPAIRFVWVHAQAERNRRWHRDLAARGVFIEFDSLGWTLAEDATYIAAIKELLASGYGDRVLLSHDAGWYQPGQRNGGTQKPYTYLMGTFVQKLRNSGIDDDTIQMLIRENPRRAFAYLSRRAEAPAFRSTGREE
jgi:phosphotriesterase-related protein